MAANEQRMLFHDNAVRMYRLQRTISKGGNRMADLNAVKAQQQRTWAPVISR